MLELSGLLASLGGEATPSLRLLCLHYFMAPKTRRAVTCLRGYLRAYLPCGNSTVGADLMKSAEERMPATEAAEPSRTPFTHGFGIRAASTCFAGAWNNTISFFSTGLCGPRATGQGRLEGAQSSPRPDLRGLFPGLSPRGSKSEAASPDQDAGATKTFRSDSLDRASAMIQATFRGAKGREEIASNRSSSNKPGTATPDLLSGRSSIKGASCMVQAAGHAKTFQRDPDSPGTVVIKEGTAKERAIYEALQAERLRDFAPSYHGAVERGAITLLRLGNMTAGCSTPCVMDLKLGTRSFVEAEANNSKMRPDLALKIADLDVAALLPLEVGVRGR